MQLTCCYLKSFLRLRLRSEAAKISTFPFRTDAGHPTGANWIGASSYQDFVCVIFTVRSHPHIAAPVIKAIAVSVINNALIAFLQATKKAVHPDRRIGFLAVLKPRVDADLRVLDSALHNSDVPFVFGYKRQVFRIDLSDAAFNLVFHRRLSLTLLAEHVRPQLVARYLALAKTFDVNAASGRSTILPGPLVDGLNRDPISFRKCIDADD